MAKDVKQVELLEDEFYPKEWKGQYWKAPKKIISDPTLSPGAKLLYMVIFGESHYRGNSWSEHKTLRSNLGDISESTINRWQNELVEAGLIRVLQKGRGISNNYYCLRSPVLDNAAVGEFLPGARFKYHNRKTGVVMILNQGEGEFFFEQDVEQWFKDAVTGIEYPFPKPCWHYNRKWYKGVKAAYFDKVTQYFDSM